MNTTPPAPSVAGTWRELLGPRSGPVALVLAGGVLLEASTVYLTTSLLPTIVADIGGEQFYAWTMTTFLVASVVTSMLVSRTLATRGSVAAYLTAFGLFGLGSVVCALAPSMPLLLLGRTVQGLGGGLLAGLGYALIQRALPERLWAKGVALVSAMWGVGNIVGPAVGGLFAQLDAWRLAFGALALVAALDMVLVVRVIPRLERSAQRQPLPVRSLVLLGAAVASVSVAGIFDVGGLVVAALVLGAVLVVGFVRHERRSSTSVLPAATFAPGSRLVWVYLAVAVLALGVGTEAFIPLVGQETGSMTPFLAGFLGAALSLGWSVVQVVSAGATRPPLVRAATVAGPAVLATGLLAFAALQVEGPSGLVVTGWFVVLFVAGSGIGLAFPHLSVAAFSSTTDNDEGSKAAAGINTVLLIASAFSAALAGVLVTLGGDSLVTSARLLFGVFGVVALVGTLASVRAARVAGVRESAAAKRS